MDVRCEKCRTEYDFHDDQIGPAGRAIRCRCGHVFRVKKRALVVTVPVKPHELGQEDPVAAEELQRAAAGFGAEGEPAWRLRKRNGDVYPFKDLSVLQRWIVERRAIKADELSHRAEPWRALGEVPELQAFFAVVERAARRRPAAPAPRAEPVVPAAPTLPAAALAAEPLPGGPSSRQDLALGATAEPVFPGPGHVPQPVKTEIAFPLPADAPPPGQPEAEPVGDLGRGDLAAASAELAESWASPARSAPEPAWTSSEHQTTGVTAALEPVRAEAAPQASPAAAGPELRAEPAPPRAEERDLTVGTDVADRELSFSEPAPRSKPQPKSSNLGIWIAIAAAVAAFAVGGYFLRSVLWPTPPRRAPAASVAPAEPQGAAPVPPAPTPEAQAAAPAAPAAPAPEAASSPSPAAPATTAAPSPAEPVASTPAPAVPAPAEQAAPPGPVKADAEPATEPPAPAPAAAAGKAATLAIPPRPRRLDARALVAQGRKARLGGRCESALKSYAQALELAPGNSQALAGRGHCQLQLAQYLPAEESFKLAIESDPLDPDALYGLGSTYRLEGRRSDAVAYYRRYLAAHPKGEYAAAARREIEALKE